MASVYRKFISQIEEKKLVPELGYLRSPRHKRSQIETEDQKKSKNLDKVVEDVIIDSVEQPLEE